MSPGESGEGGERRRASSSAASWSLYSSAPIPRRRSVSVARDTMPCMMMLALCSLSGVGGDDEGGGTEGGVVVAGVVVVVLLSLSTALAWQE